MDAATSQRQEQQVQLRLPGEAADQGSAGRLRIRAKFTGRSALNVIGQCVGLGGAFPVVVTATPQYRAGNIVLKT